MIKKNFLRFASLVICLLAANVAMADQPNEWQMDLQPFATPVMEQIRWFNHYTLWFIVPITLFVLALLIVVVVRFRASANPVASRTSHNTLIEVAWTLGPVLVLFFLAIPSFNMLTYQLTLPKNPDLTVKATATQWQWNYEYPGDKPLAFDSYMLKDDKDRQAAGKQDKKLYPRLLAVDNELVVPVNKTVRVLVTAAPADVIHSFSMPSFGIKLDAIPGRLNETWFKAEREGIFYGQCSQICGKDHAFMPIAIRVVSQDKYNAWMSAALNDLGAANKALIAATEGAKSPVQVAQATSN